MNTSTNKIPPITMSKLYIGNLPSDTNEAGLRQLFVEQNLSCTNILVKRGGYAFVDCPDQSSADKAIDKLNGKLPERIVDVLILAQWPAFYSRRIWESGWSAQPNITFIYTCHKSHHFALHVWSTLFTTLLLMSCFKLQVLSSINFTFLTINVS